jgi:hypothetical protein
MPGIIMLSDVMMRVVVPLAALWLIWQKAAQIYKSAPILLDNKPNKMHSKRSTFENFVFHIFVLIG